MVANSTDLWTVRDFYNVEMIVRINGVLSKPNIEGNFIMETETYDKSCISFNDSIADVEIYEFKHWKNMETLDVSQFLKLYELVLEHKKERSIIVCCR